MLLSLEKRIEPFLKPLGAGLAMLIPLSLALVFDNMQMATLGVLGSFSYLAFQNKSLYYNLKAIFFHGVAILFSFTLGIYGGMFLWSIPFFISILSFFAFIITKMFNIPKPDYFFVVMLFAMGTNIDVSTNVFDVTKYMLIGLMSSLISGLIVSLIKKLPIKEVSLKLDLISLKKRYQATIRNQPTIVLNAIHFSMILFCSAYVSTLFSEQNGYWILISSAAILAGEEVDLIKKRTVQRMLGSVVGLLLGLLILYLDFPIIILFLLLIALNVLVEFYIGKNYTIANFFINPQVLVLSYLVSGTSSSAIVSYRLLSTVIGSSLALFLILLLSYGSEVANRKQ